jgi:hypothetical protein
MIRIFLVALCALDLAACVVQTPPSANSADPPSPYAGRGYYGRYIQEPVSNYNPYELPEYRGGYTPY